MRLLDNTGEVRGSLHFRVPDDGADVLENLHVLLVPGLPVRVGSLLRSMRIQVLGQPVEEYEPWGLVRHGEQVGTGRSGRAGQQEGAGIEKRRSGQDVGLMSSCSLDTGVACRRLKRASAGLEVHVGPDLASDAKVFLDVARRPLEVVLHLHLGGCVDLSLGQWLVVVGLYGYGRDALNVIATRLHPNWDKWRLRGVSSQRSCVDMWMLFVHGKFNFPCYVHRRICDLCYGCHSTTIVLCYLLHRASTCISTETTFSPIAHTAEA